MSLKLQKKLDIRSYTWMADNLSWSSVMYSLINALDQLGHNTYVVSTNGVNENLFYKKNKLEQSIVGLQKFGPGKKQIDIDLTYTLPINFKSRFLPNSKNCCAIYNYETTIWDPRWSKYYGLVDYFYPSSNFSAEVFIKNGVPAEKVFVIPHGIDTAIFNPSIRPVKLKTQKKYKFVSVVAPHYRKNIPLMLDAYCSEFSSKDDVCLVLKTKVYKHSDGTFDANNNPKGKRGFEIILGDVFKNLVKKHGKKNMPDIEILQGRTDNIASIYTACDCHITTTGSEGFGIPLLEAQACGLLSIAPRYSGQLDFLNDNNSLLIDCKMRYAKRGEQYWCFYPKSEISEASKKHTMELMRMAYEKHDELIEKFKPETEKTIKQFSWINAAQMIIDSTQGSLNHYKPGTYDWWPR